MRRDLLGTAPSFIRKYPLWALAALAVLLPRGGLAAELTLEEAIRAAWVHHPGLTAGGAQVKAAAAEAASARDGRLPSLAFTARAFVTDEPMAVFGTKLDQQRITAGDFEPSRLNAPDPVAGVGLGATITQPIYAGGRIAAGARSAAAAAAAEVSAQARRRDEVALAVVEAYLGAQAAVEALRDAEELLRHAEETERFVRERNAQGLLLDADVARATAFRAQANAERASARRRSASARSALSLLVGDEASGAVLTTPLSPPGANFVAATAGGAREEEHRLDGRSDLEAARLRAEATQAQAEVARGALRPQVSAQASVETLRSDWDQGATWFSAALIARWQLSWGEGHTARAATARASAARDDLAWRERQARLEVVEALRAGEEAEVRLGSAREAVTASESARALRQARYRQGLSPLSDLLDAESSLASARMLQVQSCLETRLARARLQFATGESIEGVRP